MVLVRLKADATYASAEWASLAASDCERRDSVREQIGPVGVPSVVAAAIATAARISWRPTR